MKKIISVSSVLVLAFGFLASVAYATAPCDGGIGSPLIVDATQNITNDVDSGNNGNWALDNYARHIQVWLDSTSTYCTQVDYNGTFRALAGVFSPQNGQPITKDISGTMVGGYTQVITGTATTSPAIPSSLDYQGTPANISSWTQALLPKTYNGNTSAKWQDEVFAPGYVAGFINGGNGWSWTYTSNDAHAIWVNAGTGSSGDIGPVVNSNSGIAYFGLQAAIDAASSSDTIVLGVDATTTSRINIDKAITIDGKNHTIRTNFTKTGNSNNAAIGIGHSDVTIKNLVIDGTAGTNLHGINVYKSTRVVLDTVTVSNNSNGAAAIVNGSTVSATNLNTNNNSWGAVNVDPGVGVTSTSAFALNSGNLAESTQIWSDGGNVTSTATVTVSTPTGYAKYAYPEKGSLFFFWTNKPGKGATITSGDTSAYYSTIQAAINAATSSDTINVGTGTYDEQVIITKDLTLQGAGNGSIIKPSQTTANAFQLFTRNPDDVAANTAGVVVASSTAVTVKGFAIDGSLLTSANGGRLIGIFYRNSGGVIDSNTVQGIGTDQGNGVMATSLGSPVSVEIKGNTINTYNKNGITTNNTGVTANIHNNVITGMGPTSSIAQNGIQIGYGATGMVTSNTVFGNYWTGTYGGSNDPTSDANADGAAGILLYNPTSGVQVLNNNLSGNQFGIWSVEAIGSQVIRGNTINGAADSGSAKVTGIAIWNSQYGESPVATNATVENNIISNSYYGLLNQNNSSSMPPVTATRLNSFSGIRNFSAYNNTTTTLNFAGNWWGTATPNFSSIVSGNASTSPWYVSPGMTVLSDSVGNATGTMNITAPTIDFAKTSDGAVSLPTGTSHLTLGNSSVLDFSASMNTKVGDNIVIAGVTTTLSNFTSGDLSNFNLGASQSVGGESITISKAIKLSSGSSTAPIILTNSTIPNASVSIPDGTTILAPNGWTGSIAPPKTGSSAGDAPSGFSVGSTVISVGASDVVLLFDKPVTLTLTGVIGDVGYKSAGSNTWTKISTTCTGSYNNPTGAIFPGECKITNGTNTKILTYHFTTFGSFTTNPAPSVGGGGQIPADVGISESVDNATPLQGGTVRIMLIASNSGPSAASNVVVQDNIPAGLTFVSAMPAVGTFTASTGIWSIGSMPANTSTTLVITATANSGTASQSITNNAIISESGGIYDQNNSNNFASQIIQINAVSATTTVSGEGSSSSTSSAQSQGIVLGASTGTVGQVLGAAAFNFTRNLASGSIGNDVAELQNRLVQEGFYNGKISGHFGSLTQSAVKAYQLKHGLPGTGLVGLLTRTQLNNVNDGQVLGASTTGVTVMQTQIVSLQTQFIVLLQQIVTILQSKVTK